jgi:formylglycine-generating enzyme required for sulfatase activity
MLIMVSFEQLIYKSSFFSLLFSFFLTCEFEQKNHSAYEQKIKGTDLSFTMEAIPGGKFSMGSAHGKADELPIHTVELDPFWMSTFEITWDLFEPFLYKDYEEIKSIDPVPSEVDAVTRPTKPYLDMTFGMGKEGHPALAMTHYNAIQFCKWLYVRTGVFYRLPTEAEWEYAARAGTDTDYFFGNEASDLEQYAWFDVNSKKITHPVGSKKPNPWGLYDIYGNAAEWTYDQYVPNYKSFEGKVSKNPIVVPNALYSQVIRGGSYYDKAADLTSAARLASDPQWKAIDPQIPKSNWWMPEASFVGMRIVRPVVEPSKEEIMAYYDKAPIPDY